MLKFLVRRFANYLVLVALATSMGYFLASTSLHPRANYENRNPPPPRAVVEKQLDDLNVNNRTPVLTRFGRWVRGVVHGDFNKTVFGRPVTEEMWRRMGVSLRLLLLGAILGALLGVAVGVVSAVKQYHAVDYAGTVMSFLILSTPVFLLALLLQIAGNWFNRKTGTDFFYYVGEATPGLRGSSLELAGDRLRHLILPTISIALGGIAFYSRYQRNSMLDVLGSDFLRTAQAKGLRRRHALVKHGLRTALIPLITFFAYSFGLLLTGATFTEKIFGWHGMGEWFINSVATNDINVVSTVILFDAVLILLAGLLADVAYAALDPRVRIR